MPNKSTKQRSKPRIRRPQRCAITSITGVLCWLAAASCASANVVLSGPIHPRYDLQLTVKKNLRNLTGNQTISFTNGGSQPIKDVWLRLWANAYGTCQQPRIHVKVEEGGRIGQFQTKCTALNIQLNKSVQPKKRGSFTLSFSVTPPRRKISDRFEIEPKSGRMMLGNAVPILAVSDQRGTHITEPYSELGESFYSLSSQWRAQVALPAGVNAAMTGKTESEKTLPNKGKKITVTSRTARDFALVVGRYDVDSVQQGKVKIRYFHSPVRTAKDRSDVQTTLQRARNSVKKLEAAYGPYGSPELDLAQTRDVDMEYPEMLMVRQSIQHEIAHQWWFGIVGNDEYAEPWLDEGFATYADRHVSNLGKPDNCEKHSSNPKFPEFQDLPDSWHLTNTMEYYDANPGLYFDGVYVATSCILGMIESELGAQKMQQFLRNYVTKHRFGIATTKDFADDLLTFSGDKTLVNKFLAAARIQN